MTVVQAHIACLLSFDRNDTEQHSWYDAINDSFWNAGNDINGTNANLSRSSYDEVISETVYLIKYNDQQICDEQLTTIGPYLKRMEVASYVAGLYFCKVNSVVTIRFI